FPFLTFLFSYRAAVSVLPSSWSRKMDSSRTLGAEYRLIIQVQKLIFKNSNHSLHLTKLAPSSDVLYHTTKLDGIVR
ncbi:hypothetical protein ACQP3J_30350, partial [Escherichia coli]